MGRAIGPEAPPAREEWLLRVEPPANHGAAQALEQGVAGAVPAHVPRGVSGTEMVLEQQEVPGETACFIVRIIIAPIEPDADGLTTRPLLEERHCCLDEVRHPCIFVHQAQELDGNFAFHFRKRFLGAYLDSLLSCGHRSSSACSFSGVPLRNPLPPVKNSLEWHPLG